MRIAYFLFTAVAFCFLTAPSNLPADEKKDKEHWEKLEKLNLLIWNLLLKKKSGQSSKKKLITELTKELQKGPSGWRFSG